ncbi:MAG: hypothetical protein JW995_12020 [Melioribacteraceae bacterium]|nr:hypothetical protein [Melioribacteraceae bacterium]
MEKININVTSEIGDLEAVIIHTPGPEVENMTPMNAERALYSDILNLSEAAKEYSQFKTILKMHSRVLEVAKLLEDILDSESVKEKLLSKICSNENMFNRKKEFMLLSSKELARNLIEGVELKRNTLTNFLSSERFFLLPLHNFFFTRDASAAINDQVMISRMANSVREREAIIMEAVFNYHPLLQAQTHNPASEVNFNPSITLEGGDILIARNDVLIIGNSMRTTTQGIDYILENVKNRKKIKYIIVQELPKTPESFIHLDMVFTFLSENEVMVYEPVVLNPNQFKTILIELRNDDVIITEQRDILEVLKKLRFDIKPVWCGGKSDPWIQEREQWHSGANLFALAPGKMIAYGRNIHTLEEMNKNGYEIIKANDIIKRKKELKNYNKYVVTIDSSELSRGGGGCRCMTMPIRRKQVS